MKKICISLLLLSLAACATAQRDQVYVTLDKHSCHVGDTVWMKGVVFRGRGPFSPSTNLYVGLYDYKGTAIRRYMFTITKGQSFGQIVLPNDLPTDNYYVVAFTKQQLNYDRRDLFNIPELVYNPNKPQKVYHKKAVSPVPLASGTIDGIWWSTGSWYNTKYGRALSSLLQVESNANVHQLTLQCFFDHQKDSAMANIVNFTPDNLQRYTIFPIDSLSNYANLYLWRDTTLIGHELFPLRSIQSPVDVKTDTLDFDPYGYNSWTISIPDSATYYSAVSVTDLDRTSPAPESIQNLKAWRVDDYTIPERQVDTSGLTVEGKATRTYGKRIKNPSTSLVIAGSQDSTLLFTKAVDMDDSGHFALRSMYYYGDITLNFNRNQLIPDWHMKDVALKVQGFDFPTIDSSLFLGDWEDDSTELISASDTTLTQGEGLAHMTTLKAAVVKHWKNPREELDHIYTSGPFSEGSLFYYDLRNDSSDYDRDIFWYLNKENPRLTYDPAWDTMGDKLGHPIIWFLDETEVPMGMAKIVAFDRIAYVKVFESDFLDLAHPGFKLDGKGPLKIPTAATPLCVCIYTRKGRDFRTMRGGMNKMTIKGFDAPLVFHPDATTIYWNPFVVGHELHIHFLNNETAHRFRLRIEGMTYGGKVISYEKIINP